jgi:hypothetical protein
MFEFLFIATSGVAAGGVCYSVLTQLQLNRCRREFVTYKTEITGEMQRAVDSRDRLISTLQDSIKRLQERKAEIEKYRAAELDALDAIHGIATKHARPF